MKRRPADAFELGPELVQLLLPHRPPLQLVDRVTRFSRQPRLTLHAARQITANEPVFAGHFPGLKLWPGIYTIEGLGQSCNLAYVIEGVLRHWEAGGGDPQQVLAALKNLELGYRLHPGYKPAQADELLAALPDFAQLIGLSSSVEVKLLAPVSAGVCLEYSVCELDRIDRIVRWEVEASVEDRPVARGVMAARIGAVIPGFPDPGG